MFELILKKTESAEEGKAISPEELNISLYNDDGTPKRLIDVMQDVYNSMGDESFSNPKKEIGDLQEKANVLGMVMDQPSCHECMFLRVGCPMAPKWGESTRINCFMFKQKPEGNNNDGQSKSPI